LFQSRFIIFGGAAVAQAVQCLTTVWTIEVRSPTGAEDFSSSLCVQIGSGAHPASYSMGTGVLSLGVKRGRGVTLTTHPHLVPRLRMIRSYTSFPPCASVACSGTTLPFFILFGTAFFLLRLWTSTRGKTERSLKFTAEVMKNINRCLDAGERKRSIAEDMKVPESTLRKRLRMGTVPTSLGRFKATSSNEEEKELAEYCKDLDAKFYGLTIRMLKELAFEYAQQNEIAHRFNNVKKTAGKDWMIRFCKTQNLSDFLKNVALGEIQALKKFK
jgi:hypothetical protein